MVKAEDGLDTSSQRGAPSARTYSRRIVLTYITAYNHGLELDLNDLHRELDDARSAVQRGLETRKGPMARAALAGLEHAQIERMQGSKAVPKTFVV